MADLKGDPLWGKMRLPHWISKDAIHWNRLATLIATTGKFHTNPSTDTGLPYDSVWDPYPIFNKAENRWNLFYVSYISVPASPNYLGIIRRVVPTVIGHNGIGGPYRDNGIVMRPDSESQFWEGEQGTDPVCLDNYSVTKSP